MKKAAVFAPLVIASFIIFGLISDRALSDPPTQSNKQSKSASSTLKAPAKKSNPSQESPYKDGKAELSEEEFDFGYTPVRSTVYHAFYVSNVGIDTLDIVKIRPG